KDEEYTVEVKARINLDATELGTINQIEDVLYIIKVSKEGGTVDPEDLVIIGTDDQEVGYDSSGFWYWGPSSGFTFSGPDPVTTVFKYTFKKEGIYGVEIYAV